MNWTHTLLQILPAQQQERGRAGQRLRLLWRQLVWSYWEQPSVNEPCVQEVSGYDITAGMAPRGLLCMSRLTQPTHPDMPRWLTRPLTPDAVTRSERAQSALLIVAFHSGGLFCVTEDFKRGWAHRDRGTLVWWHNLWFIFRNIKSHSSSPVCDLNELLLVAQKTNPKV